MIINLSVPLIYLNICFNKTGENVVRLQLIGEKEMSKTPLNKVNLDSFRCEALVLKVTAIHNEGF